MSSYEVESPAAPEPAPPSRSPLSQSLVSRSSVSRRSLLALAPAAVLGLLAVPGPRARFLAGALALNDGVGLALGPGGLAPTFSADALTPLERFPQNSYGTHEPDLDPATWALLVEGEVARPGPWPLWRIQQLPRVRQIVRHVCIEGWSAIGSFGGVRFADFLDAIGASPAARFVEVACLDDYYTSFDIASCRHPQSLLCDEMYDQPLARGHGAPLRVHMPTKLGYKSAKGLFSLKVSSAPPRLRGFWEDQGYPWHGGL